MSEPTMEEVMSNIGLFDQVAAVRGDDAQGRVLTEHLDRCAEMAYRLMGNPRGPGAAGYTFANALNAACETGAVTKVIRVAMVAERLARLRGGAA